MQHLFQFSYGYTLSYQVEREWPVEDPLCCEAWNQFSLIKDQHPWRRNQDHEEAGIEIQFRRE